MGYFSFPHTRSYDSDLGWLIKKMNEVDEKLSEYLENAVITFADPIAWNITEQYTALTCVVDSDGTAYLSKQPVPAGISITNTDYWTPIFNYDDATNKIRSAITLNTGDTGVLSDPVTASDIVWFNGVIYEITADLPAGAVVIPTVNANEITVSDWVKNLISTISGEIGTLDDKIDDEIADRIAADNGLDSRITALENLDYHAAIYVNVKDYGATGDGLTDDTDAFQNALTIINTSGGVLYVPNGRYLISDTLHFTRYGSTLKGETAQGVYLIPTFANKPVVEFGSGSAPALIDCRVENIGIVMDGVTPTSGNVGIFFNYVVNSSIDNVVIGECLIGVRLYHAGNTFLNNVGIATSQNNATGFYIGTNSVSINIENCYASFSGAAANTGTGLYAGEGNIADFTVNYLDIGNGNYGVLIDGNDSPAATPPTDIRLNNIVVDGSRTACVRILNIPQRGGVVIDGGWFNPLATSNNACIRLLNVNNIHIRNCHLQQLAATAPVLIGLTGSSLIDCSIEGCIFSNINSPISITTCNRMIVSNNMIYAYDGLTPASYGIYIVSGTNTLISGNVIRGGYPTAAALDAGGNYSAIVGNISTGPTIGFTNPQTNGLLANNIAH